MAKATTKAEYDKLAARIQRPAEVSSRRRFLFYGRNKKGKTTLSCSAGVETTLVLDPERGTDEMKVKNPHVFPIHQWTDMDDAWRLLRYGNHPYKWVSVDGLTKINNMALNYVRTQEELKNLDRKPGMIDRRDYNKSGELMKQMLTNFDALNMGVIYTAQERMMSMDSGDSDEDEETTFFVPDLPAGVRGAVNSLVDVIGRVYVVRIEDRAGNLKPQRRLQLGVHERYDTGFRSEYELPDMIKAPTIPKLMTLMDTGTLPTPKKRNK